MLPTLPVLSCKESAQWESKILGGDESKEWDAIQLAGKGVAAAIVRDWSEMGPVPAKSFRILVLCGTGHNAADALIAATQLLEELPQATALAVLAYGRDSMRPLAARALGEFVIRADRALVADWSDSLAAELSRSTFDICIEGVAGMNLKGAPRDPAGALFAVVDKTDIALRAAVDLPAGLCDEGAFAGFSADFTYATGIVKAPLLEHGRSERTGRIRHIDLGFFDGARPDSTAVQFLSPACLTPLRRLRKAASDKRDFGHLFVMGGSRTMPGAVAMATLAATKAGAGLVTVLVPAGITSRLAASIPEAMWTSLPSDDAGALEAEDSLRAIRRSGDKATAFAIGPGLDTSARDVRAMLCRFVRETPLPIVIDAGAIFFDMTQASTTRLVSSPRVVFTPHMGEFLRLAGLDYPPADAELVTQAREYARKTRSILVLKGPLTRITDGERMVCGTFGGPVLARGGSGDILTGILGALLAVPGADLFEAACLGVAWHGAAAELLAREKGQRGVRTTEIADYLAPALRSL
ncbi:MAG TPA: NAD(P)H-hydrate dehydratase [Opitutales bacterium]|nr:NAD(P)H-hydrate dehydratase [Opitutales bacterium]